MPRGKKQKAVRVINPETGEYITHMYVYNHRENSDKIKTLKKYDKTTRKHVEIKLKDEKHS